MYGLTVLTRLHGLGGCRSVYGRCTAGLRKTVGISRCTEGVQQVGTARCTEG